MDSLNVYFDTVAATWKGEHKDAQNMSDKELAICALGLVGEAGEAAEHIKKWLRDGKPFTTEEFALELGDVLYYACRLAVAAGYKPSQILEMNAAKLDKRYGLKARLPRVETDGKASPELLAPQLASATRQRPPFLFPCAP